MRSINSFRKINIHTHNVKFKASMMHRFLLCSQTWPNVNKTPIAIKHNPSGNVFLLLLLCRWFNWVNGVFVNNSKNSQRENYCLIDTNQKKKKMYNCMGNCIQQMGIYIYQTAHMCVLCGAAQVSDRTIEFYCVGVWAFVLNLFARTKQRIDIE